MSAPKLDFYYFESCPYCQRVIRVIEKNKNPISRTPYFTQLESAEISNLSCKSVPGKIVSV